ncbi:MAG: aldose epimerase family protein [Bacteroidales bacterium]
MNLIIEKFGISTDGIQVDLITISNNNGSYIKVTNYGAKLVSLLVPDKNGKLDDVVLGYNTLEDYFNGNRFFGSNPGPFAGRISNASFVIDGKTYIFTSNDNNNLLHSGSKSIESVIWNYEIRGNRITFNYLYKESESGYPGDINLFISYSWEDDHTLTIEYKATTSQPTHINLTHHSYFNLNGEKSTTILDHLIYIRSSNYVETDSDRIPTGRILKVSDTPLDLRKECLIENIINSGYIPIKEALGADHFYIIDKKSKSEPDFCARVVAPESGRVMEVYTSMHGIQFYSDNHDNGITPGKNGQIYPKRCAFCLEPQHYPDAPNIPSFPSTLLLPGNTYHETIRYHFDLTDNS